MQLERVSDGGVRLTCRAEEARRLGETLLEEAFDHRPIARIGWAGLAILKDEALAPEDLFGTMEQAEDEWRWSLHPSAIAAWGRALEGLEPGFGRRAPDPGLEIVECA